MSKLNEKDIFYRKWGKGADVSHDGKRLSQPMWCRRRKVLSIKNFFGYDRSYNQNSEFI